MNKMMNTCCGGAHIAAALCRLVLSELSVNYLSLVLAIMIRKPRTFFVHKGGVQAWMDVAIDVQSLPLKVTALILVMNPVDVIRMLSLFILVMTVINNLF